MTKATDIVSEKVAETTLAIIATILATWALKDQQQVLALSAAAISPIASLLANLQQTRLRRRAESFLRGIVTEDLPPHQVLQKIEEKSEDPHFQSALFESIKAMEDSMDEAVIPSIGALFRIYMNKGAGPDYLFRSTHRAIRDMNKEEFEHLCELMREMYEFFLPVFNESYTYRLNCSSKPDAYVSFHSWANPHGGTQIENERSAMHRPMSSTSVRVLQHLYSADLRISKVGHRSDPHIIYISGAQLWLFYSILPAPVVFKDAAKGNADPA